MSLIRRVCDDGTLGGRYAIVQVKDILQAQFPSISKRDIAKLPDQLRNPLKYRFRSILEKTGGGIGSTLYERVQEEALYLNTIGLFFECLPDEPRSSWSLEAKDYEAIGRMIGALHLPTLVVQEGRYDTRVLGINTRHFFTGLWSGTYTM